MMAAVKENCFDEDCVCWRGLVGMLLVHVALMMIVHW